MRPSRRVLVLPLLLAAALSLAGCDTAEERAEKHYQKGLELLAENDVDRALVEFRNVFRLSSTHVPALSQYAAILESRGALEDAARSYMQVLEIDPQNFNAHQRLAELMIRLQDFDTAEVHVSEALRLSPQDPLARALKATIDFRNDKDRPAAVAAARAVAAEAPEIVPARMVLIAARMAAEDLQGALEEVDSALAVTPDDEGLHLARLSILEMRDNTAAIGEELTHMVALFPKNAGVRDALIQWHLRAGDTDAAEAVLRTAAAADPDDTALALDVVQFLYELRGPDAAITELGRLIAHADDPQPYQRMLASIEFAEGRTDKAIAALRSLLENAQPSDETREIKILLAGMLADTGAQEESTALVESVLAEDRGHVGALKLRARNEIAANRPNAAVQNMRLALSQAPRDPELMTIMAQAYERAGNRELMGERLALAVELSDRGVVESLNYATYLMQENRPARAQDILQDALRKAPEDTDLLHMLGRIHAARSNWAGALQVVETLQALDDPQAALQAAEIETEIVRARGGTEALADLLEQMSGEGGPNAEIADEVLTDLAQGDTVAARNYLDGILQDAPDSIPVHLLLAGIHAISGDAAEAEALYRAAVTAAPSDVRPYEALVSLLASQGRGDEAGNVAEEGLAAAGPSMRLRMTLAGLAEARGDNDGAIAIYEDLQAADPDDLVVANNLASLLSADIPTEPGARTPEAAARLERAVGVAQGLEGTDLPPLQDTYGWILLLRGDAAAAITYLDPAADALPDNAQVQYHRAEAAFALGEWDKAAAGFARALEAEAAGSPLPQADLVHSRIEEIAAHRANETEPAADPAPGQDGARDG